jgi:hypothetical protein
MQIGNLSNLEITPKETFNRKDSSAVLKVSVSALTADSLKLSGITVAKPPEHNSTKDKIAGFGERFFNQPVLNHYLAYRNDPKYIPVIEKLDQAISKGIAIKDLEKYSIDLCKAQYKGSEGEILAMAYRTVLASAIEKKYSDPKFFNGERDKIFHYFVSGSLTIEGFNRIPLLPNSVKAAIAGNSVLTIGWLKEVGSIPGNGYGADDMQANRIGIAAAQGHLNKIK